MKKYIYLLFTMILLSNIASAQVDRSKQPLPGPAPTVNLPQPSTFRLENGLSVLVVENHKLPAVRVQLLIDNPIHASGEKAGVENLVAALLGSGTATISKDDFNEEVDYMGASISFGSESAYATSLAEYFPRIMELMSDAIKNPLWAEDEFQKEKNRLIEGLKSQEKNVSNVGNRMRSALLYGKDHPKGEFTTQEKVEKLTLFDVKNYYEEFFNPKNAYLAIVGDVKTSDVEVLVREYLSDWKSKPIPVVKYATPKDVQYTQINFIDMPNAVQSEIAVENLVNLKMSDPDYYAVSVANRILGGGFNSLLNMNLREANGWTYGARSVTGADKNITGFMAMTSVRNAVTDSAVVEMLKEIRFIRDNKVTTQQLVNAKAKFTGDFVLALERPETVANYALMVKTQNLPQDFYTDYLKKINAVTLEDVQRVSKKYYTPENLRIVIVGKGSEVLEGLKKLKGPKGKQVPIFYFDQYGNPVSEPDYNKPVAEGITAQLVLEKHIEAIGGREKLENVHTLLLEGSSEIQGMLLGLEIKKTDKNQSSTVISMGGMPVQKIIFNKENGYMMLQGQRIDNAEDANAVALKESAPFMELAVKDAKLERMEVVDGKEAYVVSFGNNKEVFYDKLSGLKIKEITHGEMMGQPFTATISFSDYAAVDGIKFPHTINQAIGPQEFIFKITKIAINEGVSDADFE